MAHTLTWWNIIIKMFIEFSYIVSQTFSHLLVLGQRSANCDSPWAKHILLLVFVWPISSKVTFTFFNDRKKTKGKITFCDTRKRYKIQIPMPINKVLLEYSQAHMIMNCPWFIWHYTYRLNSCERNYMAHRA